MLMVRSLTRFVATLSRRWKSYKTPLEEGQRIQYNNFVKPHMALDGKTPGEVAGLDVKGRKEMLEKAVKAQGLMKFNKK